jgi:hypothetical protein
MKERREYFLQKRINNRCDDARLVENCSRDCVNLISESAGMLPGARPTVVTVMIVGGGMNFPAPVEDQINSNWAGGEAA